MLEVMRELNKRGGTPIRARTRQEIIGFFDGMELLDPGVVQLPDWRPDSVADIGSRSTPVPHYCGVGRKA